MRSRDARPGAERATTSIAAAPIAPLFKADAVTLHVSREKDGKLRIVYAG